MDSKIAKLGFKEMRGTVESTNRNKITAVTLQRNRYKKLQAIVRVLKDRLRALGVDIEELPDVNYITHNTTDAAGPDTDFKTPDDLEASRIMSVLICYNGHHV